MMVDDATIKRAAAELATKWTTRFNIGDAEIELELVPNAPGEGVKVRVDVHDGPIDDEGGRSEYGFSAEMPTPGTFRFGCVYRAIDHWGDHTDIARTYAPTPDVEFWSTLTQTVLAILVHRG